MTLTYQTVDSIGTGVRFGFSQIGDEYYVLQGVTVASTTSDTIGSSHAASSIHIDGSVYALLSAIRLVAGLSDVTIGTTGIVGADLNGIHFQGPNCVLTNFGQVTAGDGFGVLSDGDFASITNYGVISGNSAVSLSQSGDTGGTLINGGTIAASGFTGASGDIKLYNGVFSEGADTLVTNLAGGIISAISLEGAGVRIDGSVSALPVNRSLTVNYGEITSLQFFGVYFDGITSDTVTLRNFGTISGGDGAFRGKNETDIVINGGFMDGDVKLGSGDDIFKMKGSGTVNGSIWGEIGDDTIYGGTSDDIIFGGSNADLLAGKAGDDSLDGGAGGDELRGGKGDDDVAGGAGNDTLNGENNDDTLDGGKGDDVLLGEKGNDTLDGGTGDDILTGGNNLDTFIFGLKA
ncbi:MAG: calcium-binding protein, partial [Rhodobacteraceae bacterium]|nr:calcium-binding protein [Paracoccaceae bacterium]